ncbi:hypothetical protein [Clostridium estertheticum]|uniref:hypothetical protein n=1 Tax=Clostridium estertheticum TaxID=238834 RepID=UPI001CF3DBD6|nr:hypothetical protein [Clostridium estertheticum]MCB2358609.1 hypothetical protein [Clostridium estertheticum]
MILALSIVRNHISLVGESLIGGIVNVGKLEIYNAISYYWIYIPMRIFSFVTQWIMKLHGLSIYIGIFIADLAPLIFVAFGSKKQN